MNENDLKKIGHEILVTLTQDKGTRSVASDGQHEYFAVDSVVSTDLERF